MRHKYDASSKSLIETFAAEILRLAGIGPITSARPLPGELVQSRQLPDGLVEVSFPGRAGTVLHLIEVNTYPHSRVPGELMDDVVLTYLDRRVVPEVIALTLREHGNVRVEPRLGVASPLGTTRLEASWRVINLWELNAADFLPLTNPGIAPWITLMRIDGPPEPVLQQCKDAIDTITPATRRENALCVARVLGGLRFDDALLEALFRVERKMIESPVLQRWMRETEIETRQAVILEALTDQFGPVPPDVSAAVRVETDEARLKQLARASYTSPTLDAFRLALTPPPAAN